ncbi:MAG: elongation factor P [Bacteroidia bacterium]|nr:elongation factor P [Bacteroidia bacterium]MCX7764528.1 elongation factor P [Bacteroidia bacterium]MDW8058304.1 elongation factor P [Bacteroidia bacterium]
MAQAVDISNGMIIRLEGELYEVIEFLHIKPGKGNPYVNTRLKNVVTGRVFERNFPSNTRIEPVRVERRPCQYLYNDGSLYYFMEEESFEQFSAPAEQVRGVEFLTENQHCEALWDADTETLLFVELPQFVVLDVVEAEMAVKGDSVTNIMKNAILSSGARIKVPLFVETGDKVKVDTRKKEYIERVKG